ncbi:MAG: hypothetical protein RL350_348, partial [Pseudomonadota bacterium]
QVQTIQPSVRPLADARPAWKVLRALGSLLNLEGFLYNLPEEVYADAFAKPVQDLLNNSFTATPEIQQRIPIAAALERLADQPIYSSDAIVRRAPALQRTRDAKCNAPVMQKMRPWLGWGRPFGLNLVCKPAIAWY